MNNKLMIIAGEASGDVQGASLIEELLKINPELELSGIGGDRMSELGFNALYHVREMAFLGFVEVIKHLPFIKKVKRNLLDHVKNDDINSVVLIDYPGFNLSIAKDLHKLGKKVIYYISPQIWAWHTSRIKKIQKLVSKMVVIFPFEKKIYADAGVDVEFAGHPLTDRVNNYKFLSKEELISSAGLDNTKEILLLMPGSRTQEIEKILPDTYKAAKMIAGKHNLQIVTAVPSNIDEKIFSEIVPGFDAKIISNKSLDLMKHAKFGIIKSGTSTLEAGYMQLPCVVVYKTGKLTYFIGKNLISIDRIAMVNIVAEKDIVAEILQNDVTPEYVFNKADAVLSDEQKYNQMVDELGIIKEKLNVKGASKRAAEIIYGEMQAYRQ